LRPLFICSIMETMQDKRVREEYKEEYRAWRNMRQRCLNPKTPNYYRYGGRGITICDQWLSFETFLEDMGRKPSKDRSIERRDNDGNYEPSNCYWASQEQQDNNKRTTIRLTYNGETLSLAQWAKKTGLTYDQIRARYRMGWDIKDIIESPKGVYHVERRHTDKSRLIEHNGQILTVAQWAKRLGTSYDVLRSRLRYGWSIERVLDTPVKIKSLYKR